MSEKISSDQTKAISKTENKSMLDVLKPVKDITPNDVLMELINGERNIDLKTQVKSTVALSILKLYELRLRSFDFNETADMVKEQNEQYLRYQISLNRESRKEIVRVLEAKLAAERPIKSLSAKLLTPQE